MPATMPDVLVTTDWVAQHAKDALLSDPLGEPKTLDGPLPADQVARIERDWLIGKGAEDEQASLRRQRLDDVVKPAWLHLQQQMAHRGRLHLRYAQCVGLP